VVGDAFNVACRNLHIYMDAVSDDFEPSNLTNVLSCSRKISQDLAISHPLTKLLFGCHFNIPEGYARSYLCPVTLTSVRLLEICPGQRAVGPRTINSLIQSCPNITNFTMNIAQDIHVNIIRMLTQRHMSLVPNSDGHWHREQRVARPTNTLRRATAWQCRAII
jgi:hypothetical protein